MIDIPEVGVFSEADGEEVVLGRHDAMQTVLQLSKHVDEVLLMRVTRQILLFKIADESVEGLHFLGGQSEHLAGESMAGGVERRALLTFLGTRPGRFLAFK